MSTTANLVRAVGQMHHIDELFLWLSHNIVRNYGISVAQFWAADTNQMGQLSLRLRSMACVDTTLPQYLVTNEQVATTAARLMNIRNSYTFHAVDSVFSQYQSGMLRRYGLYYCSSYLLSSLALLPPPVDAPEQKATPFAVIALLFLQRPPAPSILPAINMLLEQSIAITESFHLLKPLTHTDQIQNTSNTQPNLPLTTRTDPLQSISVNYRKKVSSSPTSGQLHSPFPQSQYSQIDSRYKLVPLRLENTDLMRSSNPLSGNVVISNKEARKVYAAIDDHKTVEEICTITSFDINQVAAALQVLVKQQRIQLYDTYGQAVDSSVFSTDSIY
ncbi:MAG: hypothetical protein M3Z24_10395 [Chloroflexota bacterium]|nr:hypothetical protein [Chloroflexota bacterium]